MLFEIDNYGLEIKFGCMLSSENGRGRSNFLFDFIWGRLIEGKWFCLELCPILKMGVEIFLDFDYGESDKFLEQDWLFMEFYAILKMGVRIFLAFASGFEAVFFGFDLFGVC